MRARLRVEADRRLVEEQHARRVQQAARDLEPALHAAGEGRDEARAPLPQPDHLEHAVDAARAIIGARHAVELGVERAGSARRSGSRRASCPGRRGRCVRRTLVALGDDVVSRRRSAGPPVGVTSVQSILIVVDLPAPFGPEEAEHLAAARRRRSTPRTASTSP